MTIKLEHIIDQTSSFSKDAIILYKGETYTYFDSGFTRHVFANADKTKVIKFLVHENNYDYNLEEFEVYENASDEKKKELAETKFDAGIIEQEFCNPIKFDDRKLSMKQLQFAGRCRNEVGWNKDGELVCFDLSEYKGY